MPREWWSWMRQLIFLTSNIFPTSRAHSTSFEWSTSCQFGARYSGTWYDFQNTPILPHSRAFVPELASLTVHKRSREAINDLQYLNHRSVMRIDTLPYQDFEYFSPRVSVGKEFQRLKKYFWNETPGGAFLKPLGLNFCQGFKPTRTFL